MASTSSSYDPGLDREQVARAMAAGALSGPDYCRALTRLAAATGMPEEAVATDLAHDVTALGLGSVGQGLPQPPATYTPAPYVKGGPNAATYRGSERDAKLVARALDDMARWPLHPPRFPDGFATALSAQDMREQANEMVATAQRELAQAAYLYQLAYATDARSWGR